MNEIKEVTPEVTMGLVEILDEQGNATGQYRPREAAQAEETVFITTEAAEHVVN